MQNNERSYHEIINDQSTHSIPDCIEALLHEIKPESIKSDLLLDCLIYLSFGRNAEEKSLVQYLVDSAIEDGFSYEKLGSARSREWLEWALMHTRTETDDFTW